MAYVTAAERRRREEADKKPFKSIYFRLKKCPKRAEKELRRDPRKFVWRLSLINDDTHWTYHDSKWSAQERATELDTLITAAIGDCP